ncbi:hypothetical protein NW768_004129 [Fusarium equiseti]|uniref:Zn(2)-C6 fungal-type domain-containing protein n=1 Tax=Fusarium equiseti TaxID=61235 RepID=A0ABQ8RJL5_FUSEQ|nr:hypothetical protein NW768_004129 [Fusarium equiseti]
MPVKRACDVCFRRKIQCIKPDPNLPCEWCADHNLECAVTRESQRKRPDDLGTLISHVQALTRRVNELEKTVQQLRSCVGASPALNSHITPLSTATTATAQASPPSLTPQAHQPLRSVENEICFGQHWYFKGVPIFSERGVDWMASKIGERPELNNFRLFGTRPSDAVSQLRLALPERQIVEGILNSATVGETVDLAYNSQIPHTQGQSEAFILAAVAMCFKFQSSEETSNLFETDAYANNAQSYLVQSSQKSTPKALQTAVMLVRTSELIS